MAGKLMIDNKMSIARNIALRKSRPTTCQSATLLPGSRSTAKGVFPGTSHSGTSAPRPVNLSRHFLDSDRQQKEHTQEHCTEEVPPHSLSISPRHFRVSRAHRKAHPAACRSHRHFLIFALQPPVNLFAVPGFSTGHRKLRPATACQSHHSSHVDPEASLTPRPGAMAGKPLPHPGHFLIRPPTSSTAWVARPRPVTSPGMPGTQSPPLTSIIVSGEDSPSPDVTQDPAPPCARQSKLPEWRLGPGALALPPDVIEAPPCTSV